MLTNSEKRGASKLAAFFMISILGAITAKATLLNPGATISLRSANEPLGAHLIATTNFTFTSASFSGTLTSKVWADDAANPWGGLTFSYRLANTGDCLEALGLFTLSGFWDSLVDVNYSGSGIAPRKVTRSTLGEKISFGFFDRDNEETLLPGDTSAWLVIQTGCNTWSANELIGMDALEVRATTFAPVAVPEPTCGVFLFASILGAAWSKRRCA